MGSLNNRESGFGAFGILAIVLAVLVVGGSAIQSTTKIIKG